METAPLPEINLVLQENSSITIHRLFRGSISSNTGIMRKISIKKPPTSEEVGGKENNINTEWA